MESMSPAQPQQQLTRTIRTTAALMALAAGCLHIADLWWLGASRDSLGDAGRGVILLLLALGLMGTARLSLILVAVFCAAGIPDLVAMSQTNTWAAWFEAALLVFTLVVLIRDTPHRGGDVTT